MFAGKRLQRLGLAVELTACVLVVGILVLNALWRMGYLGDGAAHLRMTDASRTAYVAKNLALNRGYTTNDLPDALIDFYDQQGKLHDAHWANADRFPFAAYATAALYKATGSTSWRVGIELYNVLFFVAFLVALYATARAWFDDRHAGVFAVGLALLHPYTFQFLYWKDGDMLFLCTACMALTYRYFARPSGSMSRLEAVGLGTVLAFLFLARPNLGAAFILFLGVSTLGRLWVTRRSRGVLGALRSHLSRELLVFATIVVWCLPFVIQSMSAWGKPLFSANSLYQLPLGTRYGMGTDTWWKYSEPGHPVTFGLLASHDAGLLWSKFPSSWLATIKHVLSSYPAELALVCGFAISRRRDEATPAELAQRRPLQMVAWVIGFAVVTNLAILPLYSYQRYSFRHYLAFALPLLWIVGGATVAVLGRYLGPVALRARAHVREHRAWYLAAVVVGVLAWNLGATADQDSNRLFIRTSIFVGVHWLAVLLGLGAVLARRWLARPPWLPRIALATFTLVYACYRPMPAMKRANFTWFPANDAVWTTLRERTGLVSSLALQGEVAWNTDRKNVPAPEWPMHVYSFWFDHRLEVEDLYIESADALIAPGDGPFVTAAPGFEGYARLQQYRTMPGYDVAFHDQTVTGDPKFHIEPRLKASTVFRLADRAAIELLRHSPDRIELGDPRNVMFTPHGWDRYLTLDHRPVAMATDVTRRRYPARSAEAPWEDTSVTLFLDDRVPTAVELEVYAPEAATYQFYWNLDLYAYDQPSDRDAHAIGTLTTTAPGWSTVHLPVPARLVRRGLNKLGFRASAFRKVVVCPVGTPEAACLDAASSMSPRDGEPISSGVLVVRPPGVSELGVAAVSLFVGTARFDY